MAASCVIARILVISAPLGDDARRVAGRTSTTRKRAFDCISIFLHTLQLPLIMTDEMVSAAAT
jgi:hypothetical protein